MLSAARGNNLSNLMAIPIPSYGFYQSLRTGRGSPSPYRRGQSIAASPRDLQFCMSRISAIRASLAA
jgi:hypothetical protein